MTIRKTGGQGDYFPMQNFKLEIDGVIQAGFKEIAGIGQTISAAGAQLRVRHPTRAGTPGAVTRPPDPGNPDANRTSPGGPMVGSAAAASKGNTVMSGKLTALAAAGMFVASGCAGMQKPSSSDGVLYEVTVQGLWTKASHPVDYPEGAFSNINPAAAHFSGVIGAAHNAGYSLFKEGAAATPGIEKLSHLGSHSPLDEELKAAAAAGTAGPTFTTGVFFDINAPLTTTVEVTDKYPRVSLVAMIAPSSDWFFGVVDLELKENGAWVESKTVDAYAWDSGTYEGDTYKVDEKATMPRGTIMMSKAPPFMSSGMTPPIARITFKKR
jgi:hypothetical protein